MTSLPPNIHEVLTSICHRLAGADIHWCITGSVGMILQGMCLEPHDIDLQSDTAGAYAIQARLSEWVTQPIGMKESARIRSVFGVLESGGVKIELMGDVQHYMDDSAWSAPPDMTRIVRWIDYHGMRVPVTDLEHEWTAYQRMGRTTKADQIRAFLDSQNGHPI